MIFETQHYVELYREISALPSVASASILFGKFDNILSVHSKWNSQDLIKLDKSNFTRDYVFDREKSAVLFASKPCDANSVFAQSFSKSGKKLAIIREAKSTKNGSEPTYDLEIWSDSKKEKTIEINELSDLGKFNTNAFGCLTWSTDEKFLLYTAEAYRPKGVSFFKKSKANLEDGKIYGEEYLYREEWGENFVGSNHSVAIILDIKTNKADLVTVNSRNEELSIGEAVWGPNDDCIVFVGYKEFPQRLGVRSCTNRSSAIYVFDRQTRHIECITSKEGSSVRFPRFSPDFKSLIYLENKTDGPHFKGSKLQKCDWASRKISTLVDLVECPNSEEFPGLYVSSIPEECWFENYLFLNSQWRSYASIVCINTEDGTVQRIEPKVLSHPDGAEETFGTSSVLDVKKNLIVAEFSSPNIEPCLVIGLISRKEKVSVDWKYLDSNTPVKHADIEWKVVKMNADNAELYFEVILVTPSALKKDKVSTVIMRPHGGPHSAYSANFMKHVVAFTKLNYINCLVNYRGSVGFGEQNLNSLPGNVGKNDVADVQQAAEWVKSLPDFSVKNCVAVGGSHGGFLSAHLIGQYPSFYGAAVLLNPVVDIAGMTETTDIPDWTWVEGGCGDVFDPKSPIKPEHLKLMWEKSPIQFIENVKAPVLLLLGSKDLRVPYAQGLKYYRILKARKVPIQVFVYEDCHSLSKTPHDADVFMQTALWLEKYSSY